MGFFQSGQFPYTDLQNLNLDWVLGIYQKLENKINEGFSSDFEKWINDHYNELFFNAAYNAGTETITFAREV